MTTKTTTTTNNIFTNVRLRRRLPIALIAGLALIALLLFTQIFSASTVKSQDVSDAEVQVFGLKQPPTEVKTNKVPRLSEREFECLAKNIYFEAGNQSTAGKMAVALVTLNRANDPRFPKTICGVVSQGSMDDPNKKVGRSCQFSWYCSGKSKHPKRDSETWESAKAVAYDALRMFQKGLDITNGATHFHATYVRPGWANSLQKVARIDDHIFYKWSKL